MPQVHHLGEIYLGNNIYITSHIIISVFTETEIKPSLNVHL